MEGIMVGYALVLLLGLFLWMRENGKLKQALLRNELLEAQIKQIPELEAALKSQQQACALLKTQECILQEKLHHSVQIEAQLKDTFQALCGQALERNNRTFLDLAKATLEKTQEGAKGELEKKQQAINELLTPVKQSLEKLDVGMRQLEKERKGEQEALKQQVKSLIDNERYLRAETANLVKALRTPLARGRWGEIQLRRVVELAGMLNQCDFFEQEYEVSDAGKVRPDLLIRLPGGRQVIVDAKVPLEAYLEAMQSSDENGQLAKLKDHARQVRSHVTLLSRKAYWETFTPTPEFVILFLPAETFFSAALEYDPSLIEIGVEQGVILATPTTLIALLRSVAYGWKQESLSRHAQEVNELGHELYKRLIDMGSHWAKMGRGLSTAVDAYNKAVGSLESRVFVTARKFKELGAAASTLDVEPVELVEKMVRVVQVPELVESQDLGPVTE